MFRIALRKIANFVAILPKPESRAWMSIFTAFATLLSIFLVQASGIEPHWTLGIASILAGFIAIIFDFGVDVLLNSYRVRLRLDSRSKFEGIWFEYNKLGEDIIYAGFSIKHTGDKEEPYIVKGNAYYPDGRDYAEWRSERIRFDVTANTLDYFYVGRVFSDEQRSVSEHDVRGFAHFSFSVSPGYLKVLEGNERTSGTTTSTSNDKASPHSGTGFLVDDTPFGTKKVPFKFIRVTSDILEKVLGKGVKFRNFEIERKFVIEFHKKFGKYIMDNDFLIMSDCCGKERDDS